MFENATQDGNRRFATELGVAFEAKPTSDGTWHGFPIPWESVPPWIVRQWRREGKVSKRQLSLYWSRGVDDIRWALDSDRP